MFINILASYIWFFLILTSVFIFYDFFKKIFSQLLVVQFATFLLFIFLSFYLNKYYRVPSLKNIIHLEFIKPFFTLCTFYLIANILHESLGIKFSWKVAKFSIWSFFIPLSIGMMTGYFLFPTIRQSICMGLVFSMIAIPVLYIYLKELNYSHKKINVYLQSAILVDLIIWISFAFLNVNQSWYFILIPFFLGFIPYLLLPQDKFIANSLLIIIYFFLDHYKLNAIIFCLTYTFCMKKNKVRNLIVFNFKNKSFIKNHIAIPTTVFFGLLQINFSIINFSITYTMLLIIFPNISKIIGNIFSFIFVGEKIRWFDTILLNTRGLTEIVFLNLLYNNHFINDIFYFYFMLMSLISTVIPGVLIEIKNRFKLF